MTIWVPPGSPVETALRAAGLGVNDRWASRGGASRPLRIALIDPLPGELVAEALIARFLDAAEHDIAITLVVPDAYGQKSCPTARSKLSHRRWSDIRAQQFDAAIVAAAAREAPAFDDVPHWSELARVFDWARDEVPTTLYLGWAARAAIHHFHGAVDSVLAAAMGCGAQATARRPRNADCDAPSGVPTYDAAGRGMSVLTAFRRRGLTILDDRPNRALFGVDDFDFDPRARGKTDERACTARWFFAAWTRDIADSRTPASAAATERMWWQVDRDGLLTNDTDISILHAVASTRRRCADRIGARLAETGQVPIRLHAESVANDEMRVALHLPARDEESIERAALAVASVPGVRRVIYRAADGAGGCLVSGHRRQYCNPVRFNQYGRRVA